MSAEALWLAVVFQAVEDATWEPPAGASQTRWGKSSRAIMERARDDAQAWFKRGGRDFHEVCWRAGVHPDDVRKLAGGFM